MSAPTVPVKYRKLTKLKGSVGTHSRLWLGPDHLLHVTSTGYAESYRRYFLRDIQGIMLQKTAGRVWVATAIGIGTLISALVASTLSSTAVWIVLLLAAGALTWNHLLGPSCCGVIITAVQNDKVPSLARVPSARRIITELQPLIAAAQESLPRGESEAAPRHTAPPLPGAEPPPIG